MGVVLFYTSTIGFVVGIFLRSFLSIGLPEVSFMMIVAVGIGLVWRKNSRAIFASHLLLASIFLFLAALGALRLEWASWSEENPQYESQLGEELVITGTIIREPDERGSTTHLYVDVDGETILLYADAFGTYAYGDVVTLKGTLSKPESFETDLGRTFDYSGYLQARDVSYIVSYPDVEVIRGGGGNHVIAEILLLKHAFMETIEKLLPEPHVGLSEGLLLGVKRALGEDLEKTFRETGIIHIVVLSGYNVMLVVAFVTYVLGAVIPARLQLPFGLAAVTAFAVMVGLSSTVVRASIMAAVYLLARSLERTYMVMRAFVLAGVGMLLLNPYLLVFDTGFQLSFVATMGLILAGPFVETRLARIPNNIIKMREFLTATVVTQIFVLPILLYQIGEFSVVAVVVNVLVLPMVPVAMLLTFITGIVGAVAPVLALPFSYLTFVSLEYILAIATWFGGLPFSSYTVPPFPLILVPIAYTLMGWILWKIVIRSRGVVNELAGWTIEELSDVEARCVANKEHELVSDTQRTPIFFR